MVGEVALSVIVGFGNPMCSIFVFIEYIVAGVWGSKAGVKMFDGRLAVVLILISLLAVDF